MQGAGKVGLLFSPGPGSPDSPGSCMADLALRTSLGLSSCTGVCLCQNLLLTMGTSVVWMSDCVNDFVLTSLTFVEGFSPSKVRFKVTEVRTFMYFFLQDPM